MMRKTFYQVYLRQGDKWELSRIFNTKRAAIKWAKWLEKTCDEAAIYTGGMGAQREY